MSQIVGVHAVSVSLCVSQWASFDRCGRDSSRSSLFPVTQLPAGPSDLMTRRQSLTMDSRFVFFFFFTSALVAAAAVTASLSGSTAQCKIKWLFGIDCGNVSGRLVNQIQSWQVKGSCLDEGEKCSYQLVSSAPYLIKATHTSPRTKTLNILQFLLEQSTICRVTGEATSEGSKDPADNATNFCSLQNLVNGSKLTDAEGYKQFSNKWICPGFDSAVCSFS